MRKSAGSTKYLQADLRKANYSYSLCIMLGRYLNTNSRVNESLRWLSKAYPAMQVRCWCANFFYRDSVDL
jgi:hypothetical protein